MLKSSFFTHPKFTIVALTALFVFATIVARAESPSAPGDDSAVVYSSSATGVDSMLPAAPEPNPEGAAGQYGRSQGHSRRYAREGGKFTFELGMGFNTPTGDNGKWNTTGYNYTIGAGKLFNPQFGVLLEYQYLDNGLTQPLINYATLLGGTGGNAHTWSFSVDPIIYLLPRTKTNVYLTGGAGVYHKSINFTAPDGYSGNYNFQSWSAYKLGINGGLGITHQIGWHDRTKLFAEARYLWLNTQDYPSNPSLDPNSVARTTTIPVTFGVRY
jgi:opacity protein-like surface antigen